MINHDLRCIFVHIPKTAGNSVNRVFGVDWEDHKDLGRYAAEAGPAVVKNYFKFAIVRNPWDRLFSDYNYQKKKSRAKASKLFLYDEQDRKRSFREWVRAVLADPFQYAAETWGGDVSPGIHRWSPQVDWISLNGHIAVDRVARIEHLNADFRAIWAGLRREPRNLPCRNRRFHFHYSFYFDAETRDRVAQYYANDIAAFGYHFESAGERLRTYFLPRVWHRQPAPPQAAALKAPATTTG